MIEASLTILIVSSECMCLKDEGKLRVELVSAERVFPRRGKDDFSVKESCGVCTRTPSKPPRLIVE